MLSRIVHLFFFFHGLNTFFLSDASEREAGHSGGGAGANGHRFSTWWIWLPEEWRGDVEGRWLCQQGGAGGRHTGEVKSSPVLES